MGSVSFPRILGCPDPRGRRGHPVHPCGPVARWRQRPDLGSNLSSAATWYMILGKSLPVREPLCSLISNPGATHPATGVAET